MTISAQKRRTDPDGALMVHMELQPDRVHLQLAGAFEVASRSLFEGYAASACNAGHPLVVMHVAELRHCATAGLHGLVRAVEMCRRNGRLVAVVGASTEVRHALEEADLRDVLIEDDAAK